MILKSLEIDKITPLEKNIQNRVKEQFDIKINIDSVIKKVNDEITKVQYYKKTQNFSIDTLQNADKGISNVLIYSQSKWVSEDNITIDIQTNDGFKCAWKFIVL